MKKAAALSFFILTIILPAAAVDAGWDTAVSFYRSEPEQKPYRMEILSKSYNRKGEIEKTEKMLFSLSYDADGEMESTLLRATEDGKDITDKKKNERQRHSGGGPPEGFDKNPFDPAVQQDIIVADTHIIQYKNGKRCALWDFQLKLNDDYDAVGSAWIDLKTGAAVSIEYYLEPNYPFVEEMNITLNYITDDDGHWLLDELRFAGRINIVIMKKIFDSTTNFYDYR